MPEWTREWPTEPGQYWVVGNTRTDPEIIEVYRETYRHDQRLEARTRNGWVLLQDPRSEIWWWPVPIQPPESRP